MTQPESDAPHLTARDLALRWRMSTRTLDRWREHGKGPAWLMLHGRIRYQLRDVLAFEQARRNEP